MPRRWGRTPYTETMGAYAAAAVDEWCGADGPVDVADATAEYTLHVLGKTLLGIETDDRREAAGPVPGPSGNAAATRRVASPFRSGSLRPAIDGITTVAPNSSPSLMSSSPSGSRPPTAKTSCRCCGRRPVPTGRARTKFGVSWRGSCSPATRQARRRSRGRCTRSVGARRSRSRRSSTAVGSTRYLRGRRRHRLDRPAGHRD